jgi:hypothetical protein
VVDLKIKKEYMSSWNVNVDGGAGTKGKYLAKAFASILPTNAARPYMPR